MDYSKLTKVVDHKISDNWFSGRSNDVAEKVARWNEYCDNNDPDSMVYSMDEFDDIMGGSEPSEIARRVFYGSFNPNDDWFWFDGYANLESGDDPDIIDEDVLNGDEDEDDEDEDDEDENEEATQTEE